MLGLLNTFIKFPIIRLKLRAVERKPTIRRRVVMPKCPRFGNPECTQWSRNGQLLEAFEPQ